MPEEPLDESELPVNTDEGELRQDVPAGTWVSRILAGNREINFMCHTLESNVTVDFRVLGYLEITTMASFDLI